MPKSSSGGGPAVSKPAAKTAAGASVVELGFNKRRVRVLSQIDSIKDNARGIVYWMSRDQRVQDNWAMLYAQKLAIKNKIPLHVVFCLMPTFLNAAWRHFDFMLKGLREVEAECSRLDIKFHLLLGQAASVLPAFVAKHEMGAVVSDFSPLRGARAAADAITKALPNKVPHCQVDAHNVVPCWIASNKLEYAARTIRNKINGKLDEFLTEFPSVVAHPFPSKESFKPVDWMRAEENVEADRSIGPVDWAQPGTVAGLAMLDSFCKKRLALFGSKRNDPNEEALSNLSPWLHFGQISAQRAALTVRALRNQSNKLSVDSFCEELIVRRELADNFCEHNDQYDSIEGTNDWAKLSLNLHRKDVRKYLYTREEWEQALTHDPLWNAAQLQLVREGKMHGFLRMYWAKKILEWSDTPENALATAIYLNDHFSLDGRDPNGFVGCMWSICGIHDQGWAEREVFGKVRFMNFDGCKRKFDVQRFIARYRNAKKTAPSRPPPKTSSDEDNASTSSHKKSPPKKGTGPPTKRSRKD